MQVVLLCTAQRGLALFLPACAGVVYVIQKVYLRTSRQLRFLESESRAAILASFLESVSARYLPPVSNNGPSNFVDFMEQVEGLATTRAFGRLGEAAALNTARLEDSQRSEFLLMCLQRWLNLVLDMIAAIAAIGVITGAVALRGQLNGGKVGVALNIILVVNTTLLRLIESWTNVEVSLGAIARLQALELTTPSEVDKNAIFDAPRGWPIHGRVEFRKVTAAYQ